MYKNFVENGKTCCIFAEQLRKMEGNKLISNIYFNNKYIKNVKELYLFYRLRFYAHVNGGLFEGFKFSNHEYYKVLPNLVKFGWVNLESKKIQKYRDICKNLDAANAEFYMTYEMVESLEAFKGALLASCESYIIHSKDKIKSKKDKKELSYNVKCRNNPMLKTKELEYKGVTCLAGRAFNEEIARLTGLSVPTISRWRKHSAANEFNFYRLAVVSLSKDYQSGLNFLRKRIKSKSSFFSERFNSMVTKDLSIYTPIEVFRNKIVTKRAIENDKFKNRYNIV